MRVAVWYDWQNAYKTAREAFDLYAMPNERGNFSPFKLAQILARGNGRGARGELVAVHIHRGLPDARKDPRGNAANQSQAADWKREAPSIVQPHYRPLRYPRNWPTDREEEKGVDVEMAIGAVEWAITKQSDVAILFSHDSDLGPAVEAIARLTGSYKSVETASWRSDTFQRRLRHRADRAVWNHDVRREVFDLVENPINYAHRPR